MVHRSAVYLAHGTLALLVTSIMGMWCLMLIDQGALETPSIAFDPYRAAIDQQRSHRHAIAARGEALPGTPDVAALDQRLAATGLAPGAPVFVRIFKEEFELELWMKRDGRYMKFATYPICRWSGGLGPKVTEGDHQSPEGFYTVGLGELNPQSRWSRSFNIGFPNAYDQALGRTGSYLMVHGGCSSVGCFAMTNPVIDEIWGLVKAALKGGQRRFFVHVFPFRMTDENLAAHAASPWQPFWRQLKAGYDAFEETWLPPVVQVCGGNYRVVSRPEETLAAATIPATCATPKPSRAVTAAKV
jgi:murein L,D-transpeptidase YafK